MNECDLPLQKLRVEKKMPGFGTVLMQKLMTGKFSSGLKFRSSMGFDKGCRRNKDPFINHQFPCHLEEEWGHKV
ncbi:hypothetical protein SAY87_015308 [Trapa incisa]|uniref:Uncharacterized protein n=1 Tax=Trapa incisa TaxID=236973 RepID=A0AAN7H3M3_9MYRT|nr:hypothetical protein SAY87_015308 [Trapa incisa]